MIDAGILFIIVATILLAIYVLYPNIYINKEPFINPVVKPADTLGKVEGIIAASEIPMAPYGQVAGNAPSAYRTLTYTPAPKSGIEEILESLKAFLTFEAPNLQDTSDPQIQLPLSTARGDLRSLQSQVDVINRNPGINSSIKDSYLDEIVANLNFLKEQSRKVLGPTPYNSQHEGFTGSDDTVEPFLSTDGLAGATSAESLLIGQLQGFYSEYYQNAAVATKADLKTHIDSLTAAKASVTSLEMLSKINKSLYYEQIIYDLVVSGKLQEAYIPIPKSEVTGTNLTKPVAYFDKPRISLSEPPSGTSLSTYISGLPTPVSNDMKSAVINMNKSIQTMITYDTNYTSLKDYIREIINKQFAINKQKDSSVRAATTEQLVYELKYLIKLGDKLATTYASLQCDSSIINNRLINIGKIVYALQKDDITISSVSYDTAELLHVNKKIKMCNVGDDTAQASIANSINAELSGSSGQATPSPTPATPATPTPSPTPTAAISTITDSTGKSVPRATLKDIQEAYTRAVSYKIKLLALNTTDIEVKKQIDNVTTVISTLNDIITKINDKTITESEIPYTQSDIHALYKTPSSTTTLESDGGIGSFFTSLFGSSASSVSDAQTREQMNKLAEKFLKGFSWSISYTSENAARAGDVYFSKNKASYSSSDPSGSSVSTSGFANQYELNRISTGEGFMPESTEGAPYDPYAFDPRMEGRVPTVGQFDWKDRAMTIENSIKKRKLNLSDFGVIADSKDVSTDFNWRGYARTMCTRLMATTDTYLPEACGCPPVNWAGWK